MSINILYLYSEIVGYQIPVLREYVEKYNAKVWVVYWDKKKLKPYNPPNIDGIQFVKRSQTNKNGLLALCNKIKPKIVYVSGWMDKDYLYVCKRLKKKKIPIVAGFDDIWHGNIRQRVGSFLFPFLYKKYFSHAWVAGAYQFEYAKRLGFKNNEIFFDLLTANTDVFKYDSIKKNKIIKPFFLYVGNFRLVKGIDILIDAFKIYKTEFKGNWKLICVGNGEYEEKLKDVDGIKIHPYADEKILIELAANSSVFILPSRHDQWGVVVHEFASLGLPLILSEFVGARTSMLIEGYNGFLFYNNSARELAMKMLRFSNMSKEEIDKMSINSSILGSRISISTSAANFMSIIQK